MFYPVVTYSHVVRFPRNIESGKVDPDKSITEMMNTDAFKTMRPKLMNGERAKECSDCWIREDSNVRLPQKCDAGTSIKSKKT